MVFAKKRNEFLTRTRTYDRRGGQENRRRLNSITSCLGFGLEKD